MAFDWTVNLGHLLTLLAFIVGALSAFFTIRLRINDAARNAKNALDRSEATKEDLAAYKIHVAETFATKDGLNGFRDEMKQGFRDITERLDHVFLHSNTQKARRIDRGD